MTVVQNERVAEVIEMVRSAAGSMTTPGAGIAFSLPVGMVAGLSKGLTRDCRIINFGRRSIIFFAAHVCGEPGVYISHGWKAAYCPCSSVGGTSPEPPAHGFIKSYLG